MAQKDIDTRLVELEAAVGAVEGRTVPGTSLNRVLLDASLFEESGIALEGTPDRASALVWCLCVGTICEPKTFFYGLTVEEALSRAETFFEKIQAGETSDLPPCEGGRIHIYY